ncbi:NAD(P)-dependent dehydrogenase (short-subunit alcohol dehydrogenase family) [Chitinivorax tropicus]|uniref:NAD(P)-dependent dehydrogenase (Short-subunit alcohol dehydrogenase family) n=1 Tax=Chitinivorax tropicus TaxID=714531 RepID=A0A840MI20_9PROT|nr:SDR family NAD(P)-dependent oxidoreductase [Chitinivorax tropicus]MBB5018050.1 NAD(P)-dependent dehydrogenase (short-subunit alcohol dehydrogenase family) [Chitinivorax tropicus]
MIDTVWQQLKVWRRLRFGPVQLHFAFRKTVPVTAGTWRRADRNGDRLRPAHVEFTEVPMSPAPATLGTAVIVGVGPGFGYALANRLAEAGYDLALLSRNANRLSSLCEMLRAQGVKAESYGMDATHEIDVASTFAKVIANQGTPSLVVYSLQEFGPGLALDVTVPAFESAWKHNCLGAFLVSQAAGRAMKAAGKGSIILVGSTSSIIGREGHLNLAIGKFSQRALAQVLSRELWPHGVHVAHVLIDADIDEPDAESSEPIHSDPDDIAQSIVALHHQPRTAWSSEIDLRPWNERFWEHC